VSLTACLLPKLIFLIGFTYEAEGAVKDRDKQILVFDVLPTVHLSIILVINQLDAQNFVLQ
jgi:hypothetical protein